jgi:chromate reductase
MCSSTFIDKDQEAWTNRPRPCSILRILAICGSLQAESGNLALLKTAAASMPPGVELVLFDGLRDLPHFNPDLEASGVPESVTTWRLAIADSDAVLISAPEYGFSLPGALKNGIDWLIVSGELERKVVAITAAVAGPERGRRGLEALRNTLSAVRATIVGGAPIVRGPEMECQVVALVRGLIDAAAIRISLDRRFAELSDGRQRCP